MSQPPTEQNCPERTTHLTAENCTRIRDSGGRSHRTSANHPPRVLWERHSPEWRFYDLASGCRRAHTAAHSRAEASIPRPSHTLFNHTHDSTARHCPGFSQRTHRNFRAALHAATSTPQLPRQPTPSATEEVFRRAAAAADRAWSPQPVEIARPNSPAAWTFPPIPEPTGESSVRWWMCRAPHPQHRLCSG